MQVTHPGVLLALTLGIACAGERRPGEAPRSADTAAVSAEFPALPDSLALTAPGGVAVWFSGARGDTDSLGGRCVERGLVIVRGETRTLVPLLMTGAPPILVNDSTIRARIWLHCRPGNTYDVNLRTAAPSRIR
jgi:hypothetical protein